MHCLYVLQSQDANHFYIGSSKNVVERLKKHNSGASKSTKPYRPWKIIYTEEFSTKSESMKREHLLKSPKGYLEKKSIIDNNTQ